MSVHKPDRAWRPRFLALPLCLGALALSFGITTPASGQGLLGDVGTSKTDKMDAARAKIFGNAGGGAADTGAAPASGSVLSAFDDAEGSSPLIGGSAEPSGSDAAAKPKLTLPSSVTGGMKAAAPGPATDPAPSGTPDAPASPEDGNGGASNPFANWSIKLPSPPAGGSAGGSIGSARPVGVRSATQPKESAALSAANEVGLGRAGRARPSVDLLGTTSESMFRTMAEMERQNALINLQIEHQKLQMSLDELRRQRELAEKKHKETMLPTANFSTASSGSGAGAGSSGANPGSGQFPGMGSFKQKAFPLGSDPLQQAEQLMQRNQPGGGGGEASSGEEPKEKEKTEEELQEEMWKTPPEFFIHEVNGVEGDFIVTLEASDGTQFRAVEGTKLPSDHVVTSISTDMVTVQIGPYEHNLYYQTGTRRIFQINQESMRAANGGLTN